MSLNDVSSDDLYTYEYIKGENLCRLCWNLNAEYELFSEASQPVDNSSIIIKIKDCLNIDINYGSIPKNVCSTCVNTIEKFYDFRLLCRENDKRLNDILSNNENKSFIQLSIVENVKIESIELKKSNSLDSIKDAVSDTDSDNEPLLKSKTKKNKYYTPKKSATYCNICCIDLVTKENYITHNSASHGIESDGTFKCFGCEKKFKTRKARLGHEINYCKALKDGYKCCKCNRYLPKRRMYEAHMRDHRDKVIVELPDDLFKCYKCNKRLKTKDSLKKHMSLHDSGKENYVCENCGRVFARQDYLHKHKLTHTGTKEHVCTQCGFSTTQRSSLVVHMRKHTGERPYSCDLCSLRCTSSSNLRAHRMRHMGLKKYQCKICGKKYGYKTSLDEHVGSVHEKSESHTCYLCGVAYSRVRGLKRHLLSKHKEKEQKNNVFTVLLK